MDKLVQKRNAQGMIDANSAADAAKMELLQHQVAEYELFLQELRKVNLKTVENTEQMRKVIQASFQKIDEIRAKDESREAAEQLLEDIKEQMEEGFQRSDDSFHKECVKVYRNVQASMIEEMDKQTNVLTARWQESSKNQKWMLPVCVITMLLVIVDILVQLFSITLPL